MSSSVEKPDGRPTMENTFEITAELRAQFDVESEPWPYEVTTTGVRAFARGVGYTDEIYYDLDVARTNGHNGLPAPPCYLGTPVYHPTRSDEVFSVPRGTGPRPRYGLTNVLDGGTEISYERPLESGETLMASDRLVDLQCKQSKALGQVVIVTTEATFRDAAGRTVARERSQYILY
jgi:hypothetical protein